MKRRILFIFLAVIFFHNPEGYGQNNPDSVRIHRIETRDGNIFTGVIIAEDSINMVLKTGNLGEIRIPQYDIILRSEIKDAKKIGSNYWLPNPQSSRYFWAPNGYGLKKGESSYQNIWVFYNQISGGLTDNFSMGAGLLPLFLLAGPTPVWIVPKFSIPIVENKFNVGTGALLGAVIGEGGGSFGLLFGTMTFGSRDKNFSIGLADGFIEKEWMQHPVINFSGFTRIGPKGYIITENYAIYIDDKYRVLLSIGGRSIVRNISIDYSLWIPVSFGAEQFIAFPFLGITVPIGKPPKKQ